jgi:K+-transporting ATPase ATPase C chain
VDKDGTVRGSKLLGQTFTAEKYFHPRPSAAGNGYDAANSGGSNLGPTSQKLNDALKDRIATYRSENGLKDSDPVPADAVTASASGLDPHISLRNAELQIPRVARARGLDADKVRNLVKQFTDSADFGILGEPGVNVLQLNLALDAASSSPASN